VAGVSSQFSAMSRRLSAIGTWGWQVSGFGLWHSDPFWTFASGVFTADLFENRDAPDSNLGAKA